MNTTLLRFLERGFSDDRDALKYYLFPNYTTKINAVKLFNSIVTLHTSTAANSQKIIIEEYSGEDETTKLISDLLNSIHHPALYTAIVHGSIATNEIISYSDFDGLLIIDAAKFNSADSLLSIRKLITRSELLMRKRDALQHHGWMILLKEDLDNYPDDSLPLEIIKHGKVIYPSQQVELSLLVDSSKMNYSKAYFRLTSSIQKKITIELFKKDFYSFKNLLSEILLLPAVYLQAKNKKPIFKRDSFEEINKYFSKEQLICINDASDLRASWDQSKVKIKDEEDAFRYKYLKFIQQQFRTPLPSHLQNYFTKERCNQIDQLITLMNHQLEETKS